MKYPQTPDNRYFVVRGRLWRCTNPALDEPTKKYWVKQLMDARRQVKQAKKEQDADALAQARASVNESKVALGERGPVWWNDNAPDYNRYLVKNTPYADWFSRISSEK